MAAVLAVAVTGLVWAMTTTAPKPAGQSEYSRCTKTCTTLMDYYRGQYAKMKAHDGDKTCWDNCWARYGKTKSPTVAEQKALWAQHMPKELRANQCAQACWRVHHDGKRTVTVAGWRSEPRPNTVCYR
jgi:hypothetical protein